MTNTVLGRSERRWHERGEWVVKNLFAIVVLAFLAFVIGAVLWPVGSDPPAPGSRCRSNQRQMAMAIIMYANDNSDMLPPTNTRGLADPDWGRNHDQPWPWLVQAYMRSFEVLVCPEDRSSHELDPRSGLPALPNLSGETPRMCSCFHTNVGYNYSWLAYTVPSGSGHVWHVAGIGKVGKAEKTILFVDSAFARDADGKPTGGGAFVVDAPIPARPDVDRPFGAYPPWNGWECYSAGNGDPDSDACRKSSSAWGKAYPFHHGEFVVSFVDCHVKRMSAADLVAGWDWRKNEVTDWDAFLWDTNR